MALLAAVLYAFNMPFSKLLLGEVGPAMMASFLYLGAGVGIGLVYLLGANRRAAREDKLAREDTPYVIAMIVLDIIAPILLMLGLQNASAANASLLNNFEIVATSVVALVVFKEAVSKRFWAAIALITLASMLLSFEDVSSFQFSHGSVFVLAAAICWGFENNCTRMMSSKSAVQIVMLKGIFSGLGSLIVAAAANERLPELRYIAYAMALGFISYGLSIFLYVKAQKELGAAKTSAYYAVAPFIGALLSFVILKDGLSPTYLIALSVMLIGAAFVVLDTMTVKHRHMHEHTLVHIHSGIEEQETITHEHCHTHLLNRKSKHTHIH